MSHSLRRQAARAIALRWVFMVAAPLRCSMYLLLYNKCRIASSFLYHGKCFTLLGMEQPKRPRGRPPTPPEERLEARTIRLTAVQWAKVDAIGMTWLRKLIDRAKPPKET